MSAQKLNHEQYHQLIQDTTNYLLEEDLLLASSQDAEYFRTLAKKEKKSSPRSHELSPRSPQKDLRDTPVPPPTKEAETLIEEPPTETVPPMKPERIRSTDSNFSFLRSLFKKVLPITSILAEIPDDLLAKKIANRWKTKNRVAPISILYGFENPKQKELLNHISKAVDIYFGPANLIDAEEIEKEKEWDSFLSASELKLVISCDSTLWQLRNLMPHYKEIPSIQTRSLKETPLFLLPDLSLYLKDPLLKRSLWKALSKVCHSI